MAVCLRHAEVQIGDIEPVFQQPVEAPLAHQRQQVVQIISLQLVGHYAYYKLRAFGTHRRTDCQCGGENNCGIYTANSIFHVLIIAVFEK